MRLRNSQYSAIMREYDLRQADDRHTLENHYREVYDKVPGYEQAQAQMSDLCAQKARDAVLGIHSDNDTFSARIKMLENKMSSSLTAAGFPADYLEMSYTCPDCQDTGYIGPDKCHCFMQAVVNLLYDQSGLSDILDKENFSTFRTDYYPDEFDPEFGINPREHIKDVLKDCHEFIDSFDEQHGNMLFYGSTGVGKTFLTNCIAKELLDTSHTVIYLSALQLIDILQRRVFGRDEEGDDDMADYIFSCELLIIDDLGSELNNAFVNSQLFDCINRRISSSVSTIISTNLSLNDLQKIYSERIVSRLIGNYKMHRIIGDDIRIQSALSR